MFSKPQRLLDISTTDTYLFPNTLVAGTKTGGYALHLL